jgi:opacity protein-like surface antigen
MKKILAATLAVFALLAVVVQPAQATEDGAQVPMPSSMSGYRPEIPKTCVANGDNSLPIGAMAQAWNNVSWDSNGQTLLLTFASNCVTLGYSAGQRFTVDTYYSATDNLCVRGSRLDFVVRGTWGNWTNNPLLEINTNPAYHCTDTQFHKNHFTAAAIGNFLIFKHQSTAAWAGRVMCSCSKSTIQYPTAGEGAELAKLIRNGYFGPF